MGRKFVKISDKEGVKQISYFIHKLHGKGKGSMSSLRESKLIREP